MLYAIFAAAGLAGGFIVMYIPVLLATGNNRRGNSGRSTAEAKRGFEFSKILAIWAVIIATAAAVASFALSACDKQPVSDFAAAVFSTCVGYLVTYTAKSAVEKTSRNKHGIDKNGKPYNKGKE